MEGFLRPCNSRPLSPQPTQRHLLQRHNCQPGETSNRLNAACPSRFCSTSERGPSCTRSEGGAGKILHEFGVDEVTEDEHVGCWAPVTEYRGAGLWMGRRRIGALQVEAAFDRRG
jgi:hypothetical protein